MNRNQNLRCFKNFGCGRQRGLFPRGHLERWPVDSYTICMDDYIDEIAFSVARTNGKSLKRLVLVRTFERAHHHTFRVDGDDLGFRDGEHHLRPMQTKVMPSCCLVKVPPPTTRSVAAANTRPFSRYWTSSH